MHLQTSLLRKGPVADGARELLLFRVQVHVRLHVLLHSEALAANGTVEGGFLHDLHRRRRTLWMPIRPLSPHSDHVLNGFCSGIRGGFCTLVGVDLKDIFLHGQYLDLNHILFHGLGLAFLLLITLHRQVVLAVVRVVVRVLPRTAPCIWLWTLLVHVHGHYVRVDPRGPRKPLLAERTTGAVLVEMGAQVVSEPLVHRQLDFAHGAVRVARSLQPRSRFFRPRFLLGSGRERDIQILSNDLLLHLLLYPLSAESRCAARRLGRNTFRTEIGLGRGIRRRGRSWCGLLGASYARIGGRRRGGGSQHGPKEATALVTQSAE